MEGIRKFRVWNYQIDQWTDGFVHFSRPKNDSITEFTNFDVLARVLIMKNRIEFNGHCSPNFRKWLDQVKQREEVSVISPEFKNWLKIQQ
jgi:hypothetical protein